LVVTTRTRGDSCHAAWGKGWPESLTTITSELSVTADWERTLSTARARLALPTVGIIDEQNNATLAYLVLYDECPLRVCLVVNRPRYSKRIMVHADEVLQMACILVQR
jgi:hypothetical protein